MKLTPGYLLTSGPACDQKLTKQLHGTFHRNDSQNHSLVPLVNTNTKWSNDNNNNYYRTRTPDSRQCQHTSEENSFMWTTSSAKCIHRWQLPSSLRSWQTPRVEKLYTLLDIAAIPGKASSLKIILNLQSKKQRNEMEKNFSRMCVRSGCLDIACF